MSKERGIHSIPTPVISETSRCLLGLGDLARYRAAIEAAPAAS